MKEDENDKERDAFGDEDETSNESDGDVYVPGEPWAKFYYCPHEIAPGAVR